MAQTCHVIPAAHLQLRILTRQCMVRLQSPTPQATRICSDQTTRLKTARTCCRCGLKALRRSSKMLVNKCTTGMVCWRIRSRATLSFHTLATFEQLKIRQTIGPQYCADSRPTAPSVSDLVSPQDDKDSTDFCDLRRIRVHHNHISMLSPASLPSLRSCEPSNPELTCFINLQTEPDSQGPLVS